MLKSHAQNNPREEFQQLVSDMPKLIAEFQWLQQHIKYPTGDTLKQLDGKTVIITYDLHHLSLECYSLRPLDLTAHEEYDREAQIQAQQFFWQLVDETAAVTPGYGWFPTPVNIKELICDPIQCATDYAKQIHHRFHSLLRSSLFHQEVALQASITHRWLLPTENLNAFFCAGALDSFAVGRYLKMVFMNLPATQVLQWLQHNPFKNEFRRWRSYVIESQESHTDLRFECSFINLSIYQAGWWRDAEALYLTTWARPMALYLQHLLRHHQTEEFMQILKLLLQQYNEELMPSDVAQYCDVTTLEMLRIIRRKLTAQQLSELQSVITPQMLMTTPFTWGLIEQPTEFIVNVISWHDHHLWQNWQQLTEINPHFKDCQLVLRKFGS